MCASVVKKKTPDTKRKQQFRCPCLRDRSTEDSDSRQESQPRPLCVIVFCKPGDGTWSPAMVLRSNACPAGVSKWRTAAIRKRFVVTQGIYPRILVLQGPPSAHTGSHPSCFPRSHPIRVLASAAGVQQQSVKCFAVHRDNLLEAAWNHRRLLWTLTTGPFVHQS